MLSMRFGRPETMTTYAINFWKRGVNLNICYKKQGQFVVEEQVIFPTYVCRNWLSARLNSLHMFKDDEITDYLCEGNLKTYVRNIAPQRNSSGRLFSTYERNKGCLPWRLFISGVINMSLREIEIR